MSDCSECKMEDRITALERTVEKNREDQERRNDKASETHKEFFNRIRDLEKSEAVRNQQYGTILEKLDSLSSSVSAATRAISDIQAEPGRDWKDLKKSIRWAVLAAIIAAVMGFLLGKVGL